MRKTFLAAFAVALFLSSLAHAGVSQPPLPTPVPVNKGGTGSLTGNISDLNITALGGTKTSTLKAFAANTGLVSTSLFLNPTFARASSVNYFDVSGNMQTATSGNIAYDYDLATHAYKGLLFEPEATNLIRNSTAAGGSAGVNPTYWSLVTTSNGVTRTVESVNTIQGMPCVRSRWYGTPTISARSAAFDTATGSGSISPGTTLTQSLFLKLYAGDFTNVTSFKLTMNADDSGGSYLVAYSGPEIISSITSSLKRFDATMTAAHASTAYVQPYITIGFTQNVPVDFTVDMCMPQLVVGSVASSAISTSSGAAARSAASIAVLAPKDNSRFLATYGDNTTAEFTATSAGLLTISATAAKPNLRSVTMQ